MEYSFHYKFDRKLMYISDYYKAQRSSVFQTYWPVIFHIFKKEVFKALFYDLRLSQKSLSGLTRGQNVDLYNINKTVGMVFDLKYSNNEDIQADAVRALNIDYFRALDLLAL